MKIRLDISYDGTHYFGWQRQPTTDRSIQTQIEIGLRKLFNEPITSIGSGRTDAGVHAYQQVLHFNLPIGIDIEKYKVCSALNSMLPDDISVQRAFIAPDDFHALSSSQKKHYTYRIYTHKFKNALLSRYHFHYRKKFDLKKVNKIAQCFVGTHDFKSYQTAGTPILTTEREIFNSQWVALDNQIFEYQVLGSGFLKQMVRNMVGTMLELSEEEFPMQKFHKILAAKNRSEAGTTAPSCGLALKEVFYPSSLTFIDITQ